MSKGKRIFSPGTRKRIAYSTALRVFLSYLWLNFKSKFFGKEYYDRKITALHLKNANRIQIRIQELQGLFIKFGQLISNMSNVLPEEFRAPLESLQDHITAKPYAEIQATIKAQLGADPDKIFSTFDQTPLAAASIGQVHRATLDGQQVVVKVQHQNIDSIAKADLSILKNLVKIHGYFMNMKGLDHTYEQVRQMIQEELDYEQEAKFMTTIADNISPENKLRVRIPKIYPAHSTKKVLTAEYCEGVKIGAVQTLNEWQIDREDLAKRLIELYCKMILVDGYYHADPHPGNILVDKDGTIILLDFGAVAHLSEATKKAIPELIEAILKNDDEGTVQALKKMGFIGPEKAAKKYVKKLINIFKSFIQDEVELDGLNFQNIKLNSGIGSITKLIQKIDLREISNTIQIPKDYILLNRTIVLLMGNAFNLSPTLNALDVVRPYMKKHVLNKENGFAQLVVNTFKNQVTTALSLPNELSTFLKNNAEQDLEMELEKANNTLRGIYFLLQQFVLLFTILVFTYFYSTGVLSEYSWLQKSYVGIIAISSFLLLRSLYRGRKNNK